MDFFRDIASDGQLVLPQLPSGIVDAIEEPGYSFSRVAENFDQSTTEAPIATFLATVYRQFDRLEIAASSPTQGGDDPMPPTAEQE